MVSYQGLDVETMTALRKELRKHQIEFQVVKNRLLKRASQDTGTSAIKEHFVGPCALAITYEDVVTPAKVLIEQEKKSEAPEDQDRPDRREGGRAGRHQETGRTAEPGGFAGADPFGHAGGPGLSGQDPQRDLDEADVCPQGD